MKILCGTHKLSLPVPFLGPLLSGFVGDCSRNVHNFNNLQSTLPHFMN